MKPAEVASRTSTSGAAGVRRLLRLVSSWIVVRNLVETKEAVLARQVAARVETPGYGDEIMRLRRVGSALRERVRRQASILATTLVSAGLDAHAVLQVEHYADGGGGLRALRPRWDDLRPRLRALELQLGVVPELARRPGRTVGPSDVRKFDPTCARERIASFLKKSSRLWSLGELRKQKFTPPICLKNWYSALAWCVRNYPDDLVRSRDADGCSVWGSRSVSCE